MIQCPMHTNAELFSKWLKYDLTSFLLFPTQMSTCPKGRFVALRFILQNKVSQIVIDDVN